MTFFEGVNYYCLESIGDSNIAGFALADDNFLSENAGVGDATNADRMAGKHQDDEKVIWVWT